MKAYQEVIDVLMEKPDLAKIAIVIAKIAPSVFVKAANNLQYALPAWQVTVCRVYETEGKLAAVKFAKNNQDMALLEAKRAVELIAQRFELTQPR